MTNGHDHLTIYELVSHLSDEEISDLLAIIPVLAFGQESIDRQKRQGSFFSRITVDLDLAIREWWAPDETFLSMLRRSQLEQVAIASGASISLARLSQYKKRDLVTALAAYFARTAGNAEGLDEHDRKGTAWLPEVMQLVSTDDVREQVAK